MDFVILEPIPHICVKTSHGYAPPLDSLDYGEVAKFVQASLSHETGVSESCITVVSVELVLRAGRFPFYEVVSEINFYSLSDVVAFKLRHADDYEFVGAGE